MCSRRNSVVCIAGRVNGAVKNGKTRLIPLGVRNKILDWALLLEDNGIIGEGMTFTDAEKKKAQNTQIINNYTNNFYSDVSEIDLQQGK